MFFEFLSKILEFFISFWFLIVPFFVYHVFLNLWLSHIGGKAGADIKLVTLELIPPRDLEKSPKIIEKFFDALSASYSGGNVLKRYVTGRVPAMFSFEIVATEGIVHFYIVTQDIWRNFVEASLYAQYPEVEIIEVEDYVTNVPAVIPSKEWVIFSVDMKKTKHDAYPIKTYKYFQEDITGKMIDPLASLMETMGTIGPGQHIWLQYIIEPENPNWADSEGKGAVNAFVGRSSGKKHKSIFSKIIHDIFEVIAAIPRGFFQPAEFSAPSEDGGSDDVESKLTPGEKQALTALEENVAKYMFETKMRIMVIGKRDGFSKINFAATLGSTSRQFADNYLNSLAPHSPSKTDADYVFKKTISESRMRRQLIRYRDRDNSGQTFKFSTEELATVFHLPDMSIVSPSVRFVDSRKGGAPSNLPSM